MPPTVFFDYCTTAVTRSKSLLRYLTSDMIRHPQSAFEHDGSLHSVAPRACNLTREFPILSIHTCTAVNRQRPGRSVFVIACCQFPCACSCFRKLPVFRPVFQSATTSGPISGFKKMLANSRFFHPGKLQTALCKPRENLLCPLPLPNLTISAALITRCAISKASKRVCFDESRICSPALNKFEGGRKMRGGWGIS